MTCRVPLGEVIELNPATVPTGGRWPELVDFLPMAAVSEDGSHEIQERSYAALGTGYTPYQASDVLLAKITPCFENGKAMYVGTLQHGIGLASTEFHVLRPTNQINGRYLFHAVWNERFRHIGSERMTGSAGQRRVTEDFIKSYEIPLPTLAEQKRIAAILDKAYGIKDLRRKSLELWDALLRSAFLERLGDPVANPRHWPVVEVEKLLHPTRAGTRCGPFGSALKRSEYVHQGVPVWGIDNVLPNEFSETCCLYITERKFNTLRSYAVDDGDILVSRAGTVGRMCVAHPSTPQSIIGTNLVRLSLNRALIVPEYFTLMLTLFGPKIARLKTDSTENAYSFMNTGALRELIIPLPPLAVQEDFFSWVAKARDCRKTMQQLSIEAERLQGALAQRAFQGEL